MNVPVKLNTFWNKYNILALTLISSFFLFWGLESRNLIVAILCENLKEWNFFLCQHYEGSDLND
jgi:hypothetical protein